VRTTQYRLDMEIILTAGQNQLRSPPIKQFGRKPYAILSWSRPPQRMTTATTETVDMDVRSSLKVLSLGKPLQISDEDRIITGGIDAGGSQAISQLRILEHLMEQISESNEGIVKRPCEVFDVIGGVGTGG
jgi:hypothetical protein